MTRRVVGAVLLGVGVVLAVWSLFLDVYLLQYANRSGVEQFRFGPWGLRIENVSAGGVPAPERRGLLWGHLIIAVAALVVVAEFLLFRSGARAAVGRVVAAVAAGVLVGTAGALWSTVTAFFSSSTTTPPVGPAGHFQAGAWALVGASLAAVAGALLVQEWPARAPRPEGPVVFQVEGADDDTPPFGIPVVREDDEGKPGS